jgi:hypothetical protein
MRVQLRVAGARSPVAERRSHEAARRHELHAGRTAPDEGRGALEVGERLGHGAIVRSPDRVPDGRLAHAEEHAHGLGRRERQIEGGDTDLAPACSKRRTVARIHARQHGTQRRGLDRPAQPEASTATTGPAPACLAAAGVVLLGALSDAVDRVDPPLCLIQVVPGLAGGDDLGSCP